MSNLNETNVNSENVQKNEEYSNRRFRNVDVLILIACFILAFSFWCYAHYINDPIVEKEITINFVLDDAESFEYLEKDSYKFVVYGIQSELSNIEEVTIHINRSNFTSYNTETTIYIDHHDFYHCLTEQIDLKLLSSK